MMREKTGSAIKTNRPFQIGIIGCGHITQTRHLPVLKTLAGCDVTAVADVDAHRLERVADQFNITQRYTDYAALIEAPHVEAVAVCTPPRLHAEIALDALRAGKHVFIEKPLALSLDECDLLIEQATQSPGSVLVGFNLRWHRLLLQAHQLIRQGLLGPVTAVSGVLTTQQKRRFLSGWRATPNQGGGLIMDLGTHVFDLMRFLFDSDYDQITATSSETERGDNTVSAIGQLVNEIQVTFLLVEGTADNLALEIYGTLGRLQVACHRFDGLAFFPTATYAGSLVPRLKSAARSIAALPSAASLMRRGGDYALSYHVQWRHFVDCVACGEPVSCSLSDGRHATQVALAALHSVETKRPVKAAAAPRAMDTTPASVPAIEYEEQHEPALAAIVVIPDTYDTVRRTVRHLRSQTVVDQIELVFVVPSRRQLALDESELTPFYHWHVVEVGAIASIARAYAAGVRHAMAPVVALTEDHSFPDDTWAAMLIAAHRQPWAAVGPAMRNANPNTMVSWADFFIAYGEWADPVPSQAIYHLPGHNSSYKRDILLAYGDRLEDMMEAESVLHWDLRAQGFELLLESAACTSHLNFALWSSWIPIQYHAGRQFGAMRARAWSWQRRLLFTAAAPLIPMVRLQRVQKHIRRGLSRGFLMRLLPALFLGLVLDGFGQMAGYALGAGDSIDRAAKYEFHRIRHIKPNDQGT